MLHEYMDSSIKTMPKYLSESLDIFCSSEKVSAQFQLRYSRHYADFGIVPTTVSFSLKVK